MNWSMPRPVLQLVAGLIALTAVAAFAMGVANAPQRGRLPGQGPEGVGAADAPLQATEATPLSQERIEGPPPPPELSEEEKAQIEADKKAKAEADAAAAKLAAGLTAAAKAAALAPPPPPAPTQPDRVGELLEKPAPALEEPPF